MAVAPFRACQTLGWMPTGPSGTSTAAVNAAATWFALSFVPDSGRTLSAIRAFVSSVAGALAATDITCDLYDSTGASGAPGASIEAGKLPSATINGAGWYNFTGFTTALTAGQEYWLVFKNVNAVPATNNCNFRNVTGCQDNAVFGNVLARFAWGNATTANSGVTWATNATRSGLRVSYADGSYDGLPVSNAAVAAIGDGVFATSESGLKFTSPPNGVLKVAGIAMYLGTQTGTPTNGLRFGLWTGSSPVNQGYTTVVPQTSNTSQQWVYAYFSSDITIQPNTIARVTLATSGADTNAKRYALEEVTWDTDSNSVILLPWEGTAQKTYYNGSTWNDTALGTSLFGHALLLDTAGEFGAGGGGGGGGSILASSIIQGLGAV